MSYMPPVEMYFCDGSCCIDEREKESTHDIVTDNPAQDEYRNQPPKQAPIMADIAGYSNAEL